MRKPVFLHMRKQNGNCAADQRLCFRYTDSIIPLLSKSKIWVSNYLLSVLVSETTWYFYSEKNRIPAWCESSDRYGRP